VRFAVSAGFGPRSRHRAARSPACRSVKSSGISEKSSKVSVILHRLATICGEPWYPGGTRPTWPAGKCGFGRTERRCPALRWKAPRAQLIPLFFAEERETQPWAPEASAQATSSRRGAPRTPRPARRAFDERASAWPVNLRERAAEGPRAPTLRGGGARVVGSSWASLPHGREAPQRRVSNRRCSGLTTRGVRADRVGIHPLSKVPARAPATEGEAFRASGRLPLTREPSAGGVPGVGVGLRPRTACRGRHCPCRTPGFRSWRCGAGLRRSCGRARGWSWLQKSTSGAWSWS